MNEVFCAWCELHYCDLEEDKETCKLYCPTCRWDDVPWMKKNKKFVDGVKDDRIKE